jgi:hypothetical protein
MRFFRRWRSREVSPTEAKAAALIEARKATASARRRAADVEDYRSKKQQNPPGSMTQNQRLGAGG